MKSFFVVIALFCCVGCATIKIDKESAQKLNEVTVSYQVSPMVPLHLQPKIDSTILEAINKFNSKSPNLTGRYIYREKADINFYLEGAKFKKPIHNLWGVLISATGLSLPFIMVGAQQPYYIFFYYWPMDKFPTIVNYASSLTGTADKQKEEVLTVSSWFRKLYKREHQFLKTVNRLVYSHLRSVELARR